MSGNSFTFHFIPEEDRIAMSFAQEKDESPAPLLLSRRMVKVLGSYLRRYIEKNTSLPETVSTEDKEDILLFMHKLQLESNPPRKDSAGSKKSKPQLQAAKLVTRVSIKYAQEDVKLHFYCQDTYLLTLGLGWNQLHSFLYSLTEMSSLAEWRLEDVFDWSGNNAQSPSGFAQ